jgi:hypothetical protein
MEPEPSAEEWGLVAYLTLRTLAASLNVPAELRASIKKVVDRVPMSVLESQDERAQVFFRALTQLEMIVQGIEDNDS